jgi:hypothetical protein
MLQKDVRFKHGKMFGSNTEGYSGSNTEGYSVGAPVGVERRLAVEQLVQDDTERPQVNAGTQDTA